jgi:hypothetical protein
MVEEHNVDESRFDEGRPSFRWDDPLHFEDQLTEEERLIRDSARAYAQRKLIRRQGGHKMRSFASCLIDAACGATSVFSPLQ